MGFYHSSGVRLGIKVFPFSYKGEEQRGKRGWGFKVGTSRKKGKMKKAGLAKLKGGKL